MRVGGLSDDCSCLGVYLKNQAGRMESSKAESYGQERRRYEWESYHMTTRQKVSPIISTYLYKTRGRDC